MVNSLSVIIPCYNEGKEIKKTIQNAFDALGNDIELIVSDQSTDDVIKNVISEISNAHTINHVRSTGKSRAQTMNYGATYATKDMLVFLHADTLLPENAGDYLKNIDFTKSVFGGFKKQFSVDKRSYKLMNWGTNMLVRSMLRGDNVHCIQREVFYEVGQYKDIRLFEDLELLKTMKKYNKKHNKSLFIIEDCIYTSPRAFEKAGIIKRVVMNAYLKFLYTCGVSDKRLQEIYYGKKF